MKKIPTIVLAALLGLTMALSSQAAESLRENNEALFEQLQQVHGLTEKQMRTLRKIFSDSGYIEVRGIPPWPAIL